MKNPSAYSIFVVLAVAFLKLFIPEAAPAQQEATAVFSVKYLSNDTVYINAGRNAGIQ